MLHWSACQAHTPFYLGNPLLDLEVLTLVPREANQIRSSVLRVSLNLKIRITNIRGGAEKEETKEQWLLLLLQVV